MLSKYNVKSVLLEINIENFQLVIQFLFFRENILRSRYKAQCSLFIKLIIETRQLFTYHLVTDIA